MTEKKGKKTKNDQGTRKTQGSGNKSYFVIQGQKINVSKREDLIAVSFNSRVSPDKVRAFGTERTHDLEPSDEFPEMQESNLRFYRISSTRAAGIAELSDNLRSQENVEKIGEVYVTDEGRALVLTDELVVKFKPEITLDKIENLKNTYGLETVNSLAFSENAFVFMVKPGTGKSSLEIANELLEGAQAAYAYPNWIEHIGYRKTEAASESGVRHGYHPNDPFFPQQWQHQTIDSHSAWLTERGSPNIRLAVVDGGVDISHEDLNAPGKIVAPIDLMVSPPDNDPVGGIHGTFVAGMAVAIQDNNRGVSGSGPNCRLIAIKAGDTMPQVKMAQGFQYAADNGADVITCSLGPVGAWPMTDALREAIDYATTYGRNGRGCVYTQAVDNSPNPINVDQVSSYERSIAVTRTNKSDKYDGAAIGPELDIGAPGVDVWSTVNMNTPVGGGYHVQPSAPGATSGHYGYGTGTSFATPLTAGVACLILSLNPNLSWEEVRQVLLDSADKVDAAAHPYNPAPADRPPGTRNDYCGYGRLNAQRAVTLAQAGSTRDLYIRDTVNDTGVVPQPQWGFWASPDIWVRNIDDNVTTHQNTIRGQDNFIHARIWNRGSQASLPCWVRFYITTFANVEFRYPYDFKPDTTTSIAGGTAGNLRPKTQFPTPASYLIGTQRIGSVPAGGSVIAKLRWEKTLIPPAVNWHPCLLVEISPHDGPASTGEHVWENSNIGQINLTIVDGRRGQLLEFPHRFSHILTKDPFVTLKIQKVKAPDNCKVYLDVKKPNLLTDIASMAGVAIPSTSVINPQLFGPTAVTIPSTGISPAVSLDMPWKLTFLNKGKIALSSSVARSENEDLILTLPEGSSIELGHSQTEEITDTEGFTSDGEVVAGDDDDRAAIFRPGFSVENLNGRNVLALKPTQKLTKIKVPLAEPGWQESSLKVQVPHDAKPGDTYVFDVAQQNSKGQLVGGVRVQVNVVE